MVRVAHEAMLKTVLGMILPLFASWVTAFVGMIRDVGTCIGRVASTSHCILLLGLHCRSARTAVGPQTGLPSIASALKSMHLVVPALQTLIANPADPAALHPSGGGTAATAKSTAPCSTMAGSARTHSKHFLRGCSAAPSRSAATPAAALTGSSHLPSKTAGSVSDVLTLSHTIRVRKEKVDISAAAATVALTVKSEYANDSLKRRLREAVGGIGCSLKAGTDALSQRWQLALRARRFDWDNGGACQNCCNHSYVLAGLPPSIGCLLGCCWLDTPVVECHGSIGLRAEELLHQHGWHHPGLVTTTSSHAARTVCNCEACSICSTIFL